MKMIIQNHKVADAASYRTKMHRENYRPVSLRLWTKKGPHEFMDSDIT